MFCTIFYNKYFQFFVHYTTCCYRHLGRITTISDDSKLLSFTLNYFDIYCLAGSTALLLFLHSSYLHSSYLFSSLFTLFPFTILLCFHSHSSTVRPLPLYGIRATLFWLVIVWLCSLSLCLCLPETLILLCCVPFLPSLAPP